MAQGKRFIETPVDRTPYGSCVIMAVIAVLILLAGSVAAWRLGGWMKRSLWPHWSSRQSTPREAATADPFQGAIDQAMQLKETTQADLEAKARAEIDSQVKAAADAAAQAAADAIKAETQKQLQEAREAVQ